jgi:hypothetical protein
MKVLKTIVATAVIVFALTTVAMAGVQHFTKQDGQSAGAQAQKAQPTYTVTLTAKQLAQLIGAGSGSQVGQAQRHTVTHARRALRQHSAARQAQHQARAQHVYTVGASVQGTSGDHSGSHHYEPSHHTDTSGNCHSGACGDSGGHCGD